MVERNQPVWQIDNEERLAPDALMIRFEEACRWLKGEEAGYVSFNEFTEALNARFKDPRWLIKEAKQGHVPGGAIWNSKFEDFTLQKREDPETSYGVFVNNTGDKRSLGKNRASETIGRETYLLLAFAWESKNVRDILSERDQEPYPAFLESHVEALGFNPEKENDIERYKDLVYGLAAIYFQGELTNLDRVKVQSFIDHYVADLVKRHSRLVGVKAVLDVVVSDEYPDIIDVDRKLEEWRSAWLNNVV